MNDRSENEAERIFNRVYDDINNSPKQKEYELEIRKLGRKIMEHLGLDCALFLNYEKLIYLIEGFGLESAYNIGLEEGKNHED
ncbi:hypothetical protein [Desulfosporosinus sp. OT]|uniref:hypothetical protein n=1 Tax=Desulfosporosinus sp. OT TaxID=913865 RepID=UPI000223A902|nr:hypothetical protein [Desulfosporosinus sp. OT]EGW39060.1 hypothetical protein DOT_3011 [Desulfosporosinus sp. OT]